jgi:hypothetical protein
MASRCFWSSAALAALVASLGAGRASAEPTRRGADPNGPFLGLPKGATVKRIGGGWDGFLLMTPPPQHPVQAPTLRLRSMTRAGDNLWIGPTIPSYVPYQVGDYLLDLLDPRPSGGWVATYRLRLAKAPDFKNRGAIVKVFDGGGVESASVRLDDFFSQPTYLEIQDVRYVEEGGTSRIYFNEACWSYAKDAHGKCSSLVAVDPTKHKLLWRTAPLVSNKEMMIAGAFVVSGYGFTGEPSFVRLVRRSDGAIVDTQRLGGPGFEMTRTGDRLSIEMGDGGYAENNYDTGGQANFRMVAFDTPTPKLVRLPRTHVSSTVVYDPPTLIPRYVPGATFGDPGY